MPNYPAHLSADHAPTRKVSGSSRARREPSGVFSLFQPAQIQQFKEAFQLIDNDKDGWVTEKDLREMFTSLGIPPSKTTLDSLLGARPGGHRGGGGVEGEWGEERADGKRGINFTMFLTMMSERLFEFDTEAELEEAFGCFDEEDDGTVRVEEMSRWLSEYGERMDQAQIDRFLKGPFLDRKGNFNYREWVKVLRVNDEEEETEG